MWYAVRDHDPNHDDIEAFLGRLKTALDERNLTLKGITTDGSALYPDPIRKVFGDIPHPLCTFHVIKALTKGILKAVAKERQRLATPKPKRKRGRRSGVSHLLHMAFLTGPRGLLCQPGCVYPTMPSPPLLLKQHEVFPP